MDETTNTNTEAGKPTLDVKGELAALHSELAALSERIAPQIESVRKMVSAANVAHGYGLNSDMSEDQIIDFFARNVSVQTPDMALVPSVLSAGAPQEIERAGQQVLATYRSIGTLAGQLAGLLAKMA